ncbi:hypothetical protein FOL47_008909 [Perkinsus chesapeaki]|uniref:Ankyrin Repeat Protein n=1 Tax=Perkinsus chesapeaki TaxID=330153 RepID=A0A7J6LB14_PERCH|nr:hypothetical protein FOL47_008909 [Perkinsus chesapeaki]
MGHIPSRPLMSHSNSSIHQPSPLPSTLYGAIRYGSVGEIEELMEEEGVSDMAALEDRTGLTPTILAAKFGRADVLGKFLDYGMPVVSSMGVTTPLLEALGRGKCDCVDLLLNRCPELLGISSAFGGITPLMSAVAGGCAHCLGAVLKGIDGGQEATNRLPGGEAVSSMEMAVWMRREDLVRLLLEHGVAPDRQSVVEAVRLQDYGLLMLLLSALPQAPNEALDAAVAEASRAPGNAPLISRLLHRHGARVTLDALKAACESSTAIILLENFGDFCSRVSVEEWTRVLAAHVAESAVLDVFWSCLTIPYAAKLKALNIAVKKDAPRAVVKAVEYFHRNNCDDKGTEARLLVRSAECGATRCLYYLLRDYATISISLPKIRLKVVPNTYVDALERAAMNGHHTAVDMLLNNGCIVTETALVAAAVGGSEACLQRLLFSADIKELKDRSGWWHQSLLLVAYEGRVGCARVLLSLWPDKAAERISLGDGGNAAPLSVAAWRGHAELVELLGKYCNWKQKANALEVAAYMGYPRVCEKILQALPQPLPGWAMPRQVKHEGIKKWLQDCTTMELIG